jgi:hypothetical protein
MHFLNCCSALNISKKNSKSNLGKILLLMITCFSLILFWPFILDCSKSMNVVRHSRLNVVHIEAVQRKGNSSLLPTNIPLIIHQLSPPMDKIPEEWLENQKNCMDFNKDFEFKIWTDDIMEKFIAEHYKWFHKTYLSYDYNIQRIDAFKYFALYHYGGIYLDLDIGCRTRLVKITETNYEGILPVTDPIGISNDIMAFSPKHTFLEYVIHHLVYYNGDYVLPYLTVMWSTGPLFLSVALSDYIDSVKTDSMFGSTHNTLNSIALMHHKDYVFRFFYHLPRGVGFPASTWHSYDAVIIVFLYDWIIPLAMVGCFVIAFYLLWHCCLQDEYRRRARQVLFSTAKMPRNSLGSYKTAEEDDSEYERDTFA